MNLSEIIAHAKSKTPCASHYQCLLADLMGLEAEQAALDQPDHYDNVQLPISTTIGVIPCSTHTEVARPIPGLTAYIPSWPVGLPDGWTQIRTSFYKELLAIASNLANEKEG